MEYDLETIDAFMDGERVDADALTRALADAEGRRYLISLLRIRDASEYVSLMPASPRRAPVIARLSSRWGLAASLLVCAIGAFAVGRTTGRIEVAPNGGVAVTDHATRTKPVLLAPAPTRIIRLEPGIDWIERSGGK